MRRAKLLAPNAALAVCAAHLRAADAVDTAVPTTPAPVAAAPAVPTFTYQKGGSTATLTLYLVLLLVLFGGGVWLVRNGFTSSSPR